MPHKDKKEHREYSLKYYHSHPALKEKQLANERLNYWRKKLIKLLGISSNCKTTIEEINKLSECELKEECYKISPR